MNEETGIGQLQNAEESFYVGSLHLAGHFRLPEARVKGNNLGTCRAGCQVSRSMLRIDELLSHFAYTHCWLVLTGGSTHSRVSEFGGAK